MHRQVVYLPPIRTLKGHKTSDRQLGKSVYSRQELNINQCHQISIFSRDTTCSVPPLQLSPRSQTLRNFNPVSSTVSFYRMSTIYVLQRLQCVSYGRKSRPCRGAELRQWMADGSKQAEKHKETIVRRCWV